MSLQGLISSISHIFLGLLPWLIAFGIVFGLLSRLMPCNPRLSLWRRDTLTDLLYFFAMPLLHRLGTIIFLGAAIFFILQGETPETISGYFARGFGPLATLPLWGQAAIIFLVSDFILYWTHRWFHGSYMWRFHAIHHSPTHVDWHSTYRFHPVNIWLSFSLVDAGMLLAGFSPAAVTVMAGFNMAYSAMVHANLNWTFGPFKYLLSSPVFHRWHHTAQEEGLDKNFAPTFPLLDILFGTFYMPEGRVPELYGVRGSAIPDGFLGQMMWPFRQKPLK